MANIGDETGYWQIIFYVDPAPKSLESFLDENKQTYTKIEEFNLSNQLAYKLLQTGPGEVTNQEYLIITIKGNNLYRLLYRYLSDEELNTIISSFRFSQ